MIDIGKGNTLHIGKINITPSSKQVNEDYVTSFSKYINSYEQAHICIIADGMGGYTSGDAASYYAVNFIMRWWESTSWRYDTAADFFKECQDTIIDIFSEINDHLIEQGRLENKKIGTTLSVIIFVQNQYFICHVGDTRIYRFRDKVLAPQGEEDDTIDLNEEKTLLQLTEDHSFASAQFNSGRMNAEEARSHTKANHLTQCMGVQGDITPFTAAGSYTSADYFLLSSDGFHQLFADHILRDEWQKQLEEEEHIAMQTICDHFYSLVKVRNFQDDVTFLMTNISQEVEG